MLWTIGHFLACVVVAVLFGLLAGSVVSMWAGWPGLSIVAFNVVAGATLACGMTGARARKGGAG